MEITYENGIKSFSGRILLPSKWYKVVFWQEFITMKMALKNSIYHFEGNLQYLNDTVSYRENGRWIYRQNGFFQ